jgi:hypothetical protein
LNWLEGTLFSFLFFLLPFSFRKKIPIRQVQSNPYREKATAKDGSITEDLKFWIKRMSVKFAGGRGSINEAAIPVKTSNELPENKYCLGGNN